MLVVLVLAGPARPAGAHTALDATTPAAGTAVGPDVHAIVLDFTDPVSVDGATVELVPASGPTVPLTVTPGADPSILSAALPDGVVGRYTVRWEAAAADGHLANGTFGLGFGGADAPAASAPPRSPGADDADTARRFLTIARVASYLGLTVLVGGGVFVSVVWPAGANVARTRWLLSCALAVTAAGTVLGYAAEAGLLHRDLTAMTSFDAWRDLLELPFGRAWAARFVLLLLALPMLGSVYRYGRLAVTAPWWRVAGAAVGIALLRTPGFVAHATEGDGGALGSVADLVHLVGVATWLGGLVMLCAVVLPRRRPGELRVVVRRFSTLAAVAMAAIVVGGTVMSWELLDGVPSPWSTDFGHVLLTKLVVFVAALGAAQLSKRWVDRRLGVAVADPAGAAALRPFVLSAATEVVLAVAVVALASVLVSTSPPT